jgi:hypothetical protein
LQWQDYSTDYGHRADLQWGLLTQVVASQWGGDVSLQDVMPYQSGRQPDPAEVYNKLTAFFPGLANLNKIDVKQ